MFLVVNGLGDRGVSAPLFFRPCLVDTAFDLFYSDGVTTFGDYLSGVVMDKIFGALEPLDRQWVRRSLELQRQSIKRARDKEMAGSEIDSIRGRELAQLDALIARAQ